ncbi:MAG TPA: hypothetical protein VK498_05305 [Ferruginibacter sp.]|nr:hypothetical protein [Ferruginibacter sp.]
MPNELKDILSNLNKDIEQEKLLQYINRTLSAEEQHAIEMKMNDDPFMSDAADGLQQFEKNNQVSLLVYQLNEGLRKELDKKKSRRKIRIIPQQPWVYFTVVLLLVLIVIAYVVIKKLT